MRTTLQGQFSGALVHQLERLFHHGTATGLTEGELLERFVGGNDEAAFEALMARHGPMVLGVCRQLLRDPNDVDDAFQATFLVLVRKAGTLRRRDLLGNWLYGVAHRVAMRSRVLAARRLARVPHGQDALDRLDADDGGPVAVRDEPDEHHPEPSPWLHEEVRRLPEKYRTLVLLCYFEGLTHEQAAARLGCPIGTVKGRLARARDLLRKRLVRRGVTPSAAALAAHLARPDIRAAVPESLKIVTLNAARAVAGTAGSSIVAASSVSLPVATLVDGVLQAMIMTKLKAVALTLLVIGAVTTGVVVGAAQGIARKAPIPQDHVAAKSTEPKVASSRAVDRGKAEQAGGSGSSSPFEEDQGSGSSSPFEEDQGSATARGAGRGGRARAGAGMANMMRNEGMVGGDGNVRSVEFQNRLTIAHLAAALAASDQRPKNEALLKGLDELVTMPFAKPTPLSDVLKHIKASSGRPGRAPLPIYVDPKGLKDADATLDSEVIMDLEAAPLKTALRLMLKQLGLAYCVRDGVIIISSVDGVREELAEAARELLGSGNEEIDIPMLNEMGILGRGMSGVPGGMTSGGMGMMRRNIQ